MAHEQSNLLEPYKTALREYLKGRNDSSLVHAHEIGQRAAAEPLNITEIVFSHHAILKEVLDTVQGQANARGVIDLAGEFLGRALASYDALRPKARDVDEASNAILQFTDALCHDLRTPLTSVLGSAGMLEEVLGPRMAGQERQLLENVLEGGERLKHRTDQLADLIGFQSGNISLDRKLVNLNVLLSQVFQRLEPEVAKAGLRLAVQLDPRVPAEFSVDAERLDQVVTELVENAVKFGTGGGRVEVTVRATNNALSVMVRDYGKGISTEAQSRLFRPFFEVISQARRIPGLGLVLCHEIVSSHGGRMWVASPEGQGTVVGFVIPNSSN